MYKSAMENICSLCFQPAALFQVPGYTLPTCMKCSEHLTAKGITANFYQSIRQDLVSQQQQQQQQQQQSQNPEQNSSIITQTVILQQPHSQDQQGSEKEQSSSEQSDNVSNQPLSSGVNEDIIKKIDTMPFDLEKTLQNLDVDVLFNEEGTCPLCSKTFSRKSSLLTHIRNHSAERKYVCAYCQKGFTQAANLRNHERIHTNDRPYVCADCGKAFTQITNLNNHRRLHTGERPFVCIEPECGRSFAQVTNLNNHMKTHHKVQQYCCNLCPKKFTQVTSLNQHLQAHAGITGFYCPRCPDKTFKQQSQLHTHMKGHGLAFPFECQKCDEKFLQQAHLDQHNKMHDEFKFKCDMCPSCFNQESLLKKHIQRHIEGSELPPPKRSKKHRQQLQELELQGINKIEPTDANHREKSPKRDKVNNSTVDSTTLGNNTIRINRNNITVSTSSAINSIPNGAISIETKNGENSVETRDENLKCNDCGMIFTNDNALREHIFYKHPERRFMQAILEENKYLMKIQKQQSFVCNLCCNVFKSHLALVRHTAKFHGEFL